MKFTRYLEANKEPAWEDKYIRYRELKKLIAQILEEGAPVYVPTALSLTVGREREDARSTPQEQFFLDLEADVKRINDFTTGTATALRSQLRDVSVGLAGSDLSDGAARERWLVVARRLGESYLRLEKYVNINYAGLQKILKKHDKMLPEAPCAHFYKVHINRQPWVRGDHHDIQVTLSRIFSQLHSAATAAAATAATAAAAQAAQAQAAAAQAAAAAGAGPSTSTSGSHSVPPIAQELSFTTPGLAPSASGSASGGSSTGPFASTSTLAPPAVLGASLSYTHHQPQPPVFAGPQSYSYTTQYAPPPHGLVNPPMHPQVFAPQQHVLHAPPLPHGHVPHPHEAMHVSHLGYPAAGPYGRSGSMAHYGYPHGGGHPHLNPQGQLLAVHHRDFYQNTYWVRPQDLAQVKHVLMQHLQLLPPPINATGGAPGGSTAAAASGAAALWAECDAAVERDVSTRAGAAASAALAAETRAAAGGSESGKHKRSLSQGQLLLGSGGASGGMEGGVVGGSSGDNSRHGGSTAEDMLDINQVTGRDTVNTMFLDNPSLELYHSLLYGRPYATTLQLRWYGSHVPETVEVIRQVHREGWQPEECTEDSFPIQETRVADFLNGRWTWADARKLMMGEEEGRVRYRTSTSTGRHGADPSNSPYDSFYGGAVPSSSSRQLPYGPGGGAGGPGGQALAPGSLGVAAVGSPAGSFGGGLDAGQRSRSGLYGGGYGGGGYGQPPDPMRLAQEYALFKSFTEVARLVESKGLQPMVQVRYRQTAFTEPLAECGLKAVIEEDVQMLLEYSYDTSTRLSHGLWKQEHPADAIEFPYAILKLHRDHAGTEAPKWLLELLSSGVIRPMNDFSKFLHSCAGLLPDLVRAVPQWVDDPEVQRSLYANVVANEDLQALLLAGHNVVAELEDGVLADEAEALRQKSKAARAKGAAQGGVGGSSSSTTAGQGGNGAKGGREARRSSTQGRGGAVEGAAGGAGGSAFTGYAGLGEQAEDESPVLPLLHSLQRSDTRVMRMGSVPAGAGPGWQAKLLQRQALQGRAYAPQLMFVDPSQFLRNERIFLMWLRTAITVGGLATGLLGFSATAHTDPSEVPTIHIGELTSFVLMIIAIAMAAYGTGAFVWRSTRFYELHSTRFDDTTGALAMTAMVTLLLFGLLICNMADLMEVLGGDDDDGGGGGDAGGGGDPGGPPGAGGAGALLRLGLMLGRAGGAGWLVGQGDGAAAR